MTNRDTEGQFVTVTPPKSGSQTSYSLTNTSLKRKRVSR